MKKVCVWVVFLVFQMSLAYATVCGGNGGTCASSCGTYEVEADYSCDTGASPLFRKDPRVIITGRAVSDPQICCVPLHLVNKKDMSMFTSKESFLMN